MKMTKQKGKGEMMSLRKGLALLLLAAFSITSVIPANAVTFSSGLLNGSGVPVTLTAVQKLGTTANGANQTVVPVRIRLQILASELESVAAGTNAANGDDFGISDNGQPLTNGTFVHNANPRVILIRAPKIANGATVDTNFTKLRNAASFGNANIPAYTELGAGNLVDYANVTTGGPLLTNVSIISGQANLPNAGNGFVWQCALLEATAAASFLGNPSPMVPGDIICTVIRTSNTGNNSTTGIVTADITGFGLAVDPAGVATTTGDLNGSNIDAVNGGVQGNGGAYRSGLPTVGNNTAIKVAQLGSGDTLKFFKMGDTDGNIAATAKLDAAANPSTVFASEFPGSSVTVQPGFTGGGTNVAGNILLLGATELAESSTNTPYFNSGFNTSSFNLQSGTRVLATTGNAELNTADLTSLSVFPNTTNSRITVTFGLEDSSGNTSAATLSVTKAVVSLLSGRRGPGLTGLRGAGIIVAATEARDGFLGAWQNTPFGGGTTTPVNAATDFGLAAFGDLTAAGANANLTVLDTASAGFLDNAAQATVLGDPTPTTTHPAAPAPVGVGPTFNAVGGLGATGLAGEEIFAHSLVRSIAAGATSNVLSYEQVNLAGGVAAGTTLTLNAAAPGAYDATDRLASSNELSVPVVNNGKAFYVIVTGNEAGAALTNATTVIADTNLPALAENLRRATVESAAGANNALNNVVAVMKLTNNVLEIIPVSEQFSGVRALMALRVFATISNLTADIKNAGVVLTATATGNGLPAAGTKVSVASIISNNGFNANMAADVVPLDGTNANLIKKDANNNFAQFTLPTLTGANTNIDTIEEALGTGFSLVTDDPALNPGGTLGTDTRGPRGTFQSDGGRGIRIAESSAGAFTALNSLSSNEVIRFTFVGCDIVNYTATVANLFNLQVTGGLANAAISRVQSIASGFTEAFVEVNNFAATATTVSMLRQMALSVRPNALACPNSTTTPSVRIEGIDTKGTTALTDDILHSTIATVDLTGEVAATATATSGFLEALTTSYRNFSLSTFQEPTSTTPANNNLDQLIANGAEQQNYAAAPTSSINLVVATAGAGDLIGTVCVTENYEGAIPLGDSVRGVPTQVGLTNIARVFISLVTSLNGRLNGGPARVHVSGTSLALANNAVAAVGGAFANELRQQIVRRTVSGSANPSDELTTICFEGLTVTSIVTPLAATDILARIVVDDNNTTEDIVTGADVPMAISTGQAPLNTNESIFENMRDIAGNTADQRLSFQAGKVQGATTNTDTQILFNSAVNVPLFNTAATSGPARLSGAVISQLDDGTYDLFTEDTSNNRLLVNTTATAAGESQVQITGLAGIAEAGSQIVATALSGTPADVVRAHVQPDGSFQLAMKANEGVQISLQQFPTSTRATSPLQIVTINAQDVNIAPTLVAATVDTNTDTLVNRGKAAVLFTLEAIGQRTDGSDFVPVASDLQLGGRDVIAVTGDATKFIGFLRPRDADLRVTHKDIDGSSVNTVSLTGLTINTGGRNSRRPRRVRVRRRSNGEVRVRASSGVRKSGILTLINVTTGAVVEPDVLRTRRSRQRQDFDGTQVPAGTYVFDYHTPFGHRTRESVQVTL